MLGRKGAVQGWTVKGVFIHRRADRLEKESHRIRELPAHVFCRRTAKRLGINLDREVPEGCPVDSDVATTSDDPNSVELGKVAFEVANSLDSGFVLSVE